MSAPAAEFVIKTSDNVHKVRGIYHNALMKRTPSESAVRAATEVFKAAGGTLRTREAAERGIHYSTLYGMHGAGLLEQLSRGVYRLTELQAPSKYDVVAVAERVPDAVLCLISALDFHEIGTQIPSAVSIAIGGKDWHPQFDYPRVRIYRMSGEALTAGIEEHTIDGTAVKVFNPAKTVADCFKFRNKTGLDVALEALRETVRSRKATRNEIMRYAEIDRVSKIVRPYLEAME
ncbi:MAG: type IV toxin-antitoxin system AbiEi family antitoxin domain-containing protein [Actinomycetota bacterium]|nr:type IV toxin-antitoxin system AbiEi family antitoxin domain-containing protein [Actinomycetota bacterium]